MAFNLFKHLSQAPTNPKAAPKPRQFDVADLYRGPAAVAPEGEEAGQALDEKLRQAYFWIVNNAIISPHYDIEYNDGPHQSYRVGDSKRLLTLPSAQSYSSFVLLPLLTFAARRKCLIVGGPGRGKTASAILMGVLSGASVKDVKRGMQHGHPQMTIADLLGNPLPADLVNAQSMDQIRIAWRAWLGMRVKIIDEYNRIPTRTQSALLTVMSDNYAEVLNQIYECPEAAWFLTANDEQGGGTYQVIEALRDRIDVVVQALAFNPRFLGDLLARIEENLKPEELVPAELVFTPEQLDALGDAVRAVEIPEPVRRRLEFFASQFELMETAGGQFEYMTKDTARLSGVDWQQVVAADDGRDRLKDLGCQTRNGVSERNLMTLLVYAKALAYFRGNGEVELEDLRQILPFVLHDKLQPDLDAPFFGLPEHAAFRTDRLGWLRHLFDLACAEYDRLDLDRNDPVGELARQFAQGLDGVSERDTRTRLAKIERTIDQLVKGRKLYGPQYDDLLKLKYLHQRYTNYLAWLRSR
ncbi:ATPase family protein associated with various cellular activities (AAA) [Pseudoduganella flava]|uniref:ATPase n=1 Tax=Pseudoduganella flava TaxID=871742 RepID=A0A562PET4_9BURK|nr:AAA family ATPase [Pseudoduganella flava]QGZ38870.1 ATPase [Pseudoduganella flava]TWI42941.1 ATPase family protein associated with various cellular activities (AAA) [Pseudoduganella flava]